MSTIAKLEPNIRVERAQRRAGRRFFAQYGNLKSDIGVMCIAIHDTLVKLAKDPRRNGAAKQRIARRIELEFDANMKAAQAKADTPVADKRKLKSL
jgi:hypothetical protein